MAPAPRLDHRRRRERGFRIALALLLTCLALGPATALATSDLDGVLEGFEDGDEDSAVPPGESQPAVGEDDEAVLEGFGDRPERDDAGTDPDAVLEGFEAAPSPAPSASAARRWPWLALDGHLRLATTVNTAHQAPPPGQTDWRGLSRLRGEALLAADARLPQSWRFYLSGTGFYDLAYAINGRDDYSQELLADYEAETELGESYLEGGLSRHLDLKAGRQIIVWGKSDNIRITDVLNPLDLRTPGLTDVADLRLPVAATRLDLHGGPWTLTGVAIHEIRFNKRPSFGSDFYPFDRPPPAEEIPESSLARTEYGLALAGMFRGWDLALSWADTFSDLGHLEPDPAQPGQVVRKHERLQQFGLAANWALGNWLLKAEAARIEGLRYFNAPGRSFGRLDLLVGIEYAGWRESVVSVELADRYLLDHDARLEAAPDAVKAHEPQLVVRLSRDLFHDTLNLSVLASWWGRNAENGGLQRYTATYEFTDALELRLGFVAYQSGKQGQLRGVGDNDRLLAELTYFF